LLQAPSGIDLRIRESLCLHPCGEIDLHPLRDRDHAFRGMLHLVVCHEREGRWSCR
jgi:hypothetical protein